MIINFEGIPIYSVFFISSLLVNCILIFWFGKKQNIDRNTILCSLTIETLGIIVGAKILNMIQIKENNSFYYAGFSAYGGVIGGIIALYYFSKMYNVPIKKMLNIYIPLLPLLYSVSKLGCFFAGCCYGIEYNGFGNVLYTYSDGAPVNTNVFPVQLAESIVNFIIFVYLVCSYNKNKDSLKPISDVFVLCGISKFALEFLRASWNGNISSTQLISIVFIWAGVVIKIESWRKNEKK